MGKLCFTESIIRDADALVRGHAFFRHNLNHRHGWLVLPIRVGQILQIQHVWLLPPQTAPSNILPAFHSPDLETRGHPWPLPPHRLRWSPCPLDYPFSKPHTWLPVPMMQVAQAGSTSLYTWLSAGVMFSDPRFSPLGRLPSRHLFTLTTNSGSYLTVSDLKNIAITWFIQAHFYKQNTTPYACMWVYIYTSFLNEYTRASKPLL